MLFQLNGMEGNYLVKANFTDGICRVVGKAEVFEDKLMVCGVWLTVVSKQDYK